MIRRMVSTLAIMGMAAMAFGGQAQTPRPQLDLDTALKIQGECLVFAKAKNIKVSIAVYDYAGRPISSAHMDGASTAVIEIADWKAKSAAMFEIATEETAKWGTRDVPILSTFGGGLPIFDASGNALGGIGVSGASTEDDIACSQAGITAAGMKSKR